MYVLKLKENMLYFPPLVRGTLPTINKSFSQFHLHHCHIRQGRHAFGHPVTFLRSNLCGQERRARRFRPQSASKRRPATSLYRCLRFVCTTRLAYARFAQHPGPRMRVRPSSLLGRPSISSVLESQGGQHLKTEIDIYIYRSHKMSF